MEIIKRKKCLSQTQFVIWHAEKEKKKYRYKIYYTKEERRNERTKEGTKKKKGVITWFVRFRNLTERKQVSLRNS